MWVNQNNTNKCRDAKFCVSTFVFIWFVINLLQAIFTNIHEDEAYYALYGEHLAWGYFDHPPMVGLMTFLSSIFFSGTLGVRFFTIIASCLSLIVIWRIATFNGRPFDKLRDLTPSTQDKVVELVEIEIRRSQTPTRKHLILFFTIAFSIVIINLYGFVTTPDVSLILFSALFLLVYQRYLEESTWPHVLLMGVLMALMVYSKYHAFLLLGLIVLSNLKLLKDGKFWVACFVALALLTPHVLWQVNNGFPSFKYHLSGRSEPFRWSYFLEYLPNQLLIFNPFTFLAVVYVLIKDGCLLTPPCPPLRGGIFGRGLKFILIGFFFFFWLMAFRGHVEPHWTAVCALPMIVLVYRKALTDGRLQKFIKRFVAPSLVLVLFMRIALLTPLSAPFGFCNEENHYKAVESVAGERPVAFLGSFQQPALYHYFTGKESAAIHFYYDRATQYDLWQFDTAWIGKPVLVYGVGGASAQRFQVGEESFMGYLTDNFQTAMRLAMTFKITSLGEEQPPVIHANDRLEIEFSIHNPCRQTIEFQPEMMLKLVVLDQNKVYYGDYEPITVLQPDEIYNGSFSVVLDEKTRIGKNRLLLCIGDRIAIFGSMENAVNVIVEKP